MPSRDMQLLRHIQRYCVEVEMAMERFGDDKSGFIDDAVYRNAVAMPIQQIGELAKHLSDDFIEMHADIPWKQIKGIRTWFAHQYMNMDREVIWEVMHEGIPPLKNFCTNILESGGIE